MTMNVGKEVAALKRMGVTSGESAGERDGPGRRRARFGGAVHGQQRACFPQSDVDGRRLDGCARVTDHKGS